MARETHDTQMNQIIIKSLINLLDIHRAYWHTTHKHPYESLYRKQESKNKKSEKYLRGFSRKSFVGNKMVKHKIERVIN